MTLLHKDLEEGVLEKIRPATDEYTKRDLIFSKVKEVLEEKLKKSGLRGEVTLQGSARKETWLRGELELDVFVLFPPSTKEWIREVAYPVILEAARELGEPEVRFAEHPYVRLLVEDVPVELVPAFKVRSGSEAITAVDRTPFHTEWFLKAVERLGNWVKDEVRLLKKFFKGIGVYGAEVKVRGFSGYLTELLIVHHKGFAELFGAAERWRPPVVLDTVGEGLANLKRKFRGAAMIVPDPVDPKRNAAAAVSLETLAWAVLAMRVYKRSPSETFYFPTIPEDAVPKLPTFLVKIPLKGNNPPETIWGELRRVSKSLLKELGRLGFQVTRSSLWSDERELACIALEVLNPLLPPLEVKRGPPVWAGEHVLKFVEKHATAPIGPWLEGDKLFVVERRKIRTLEEAVLGYIKRLKADSLDLGSVSVEEVRGSPKEAWLRAFLRGKPTWWRSA